MSTSTSAPSSVAIDLDIVWNGNTPEFTFSSEFAGVSSDGTLDFSTAASPVDITISLISGGGETFASPTISVQHYGGTPPATCTFANNNGQGVFSGMALSVDKRTFTMSDRNQGSARFFYALWFAKSGMSAFPCDPIIINK